MPEKEELQSNNLQLHVRWLTSLYVRAYTPLGLKHTMLNEELSLDKLKNGSVQLRTALLYISRGELTYRVSR